MSNNEGEAQKKKLLDSVKETGELAKTIEKLLKDRVEVVIVENQDELDILDLECTRLESQVEALKGDVNSSDKVQEILKAIDEIKKRRSEISSKTVRACMVPLKYRESRIVQTAVVEALISTEGMDFDMDTRIAMVIQEKKMMTVYLSLRKADSQLERYYKDLEDFVKTSDQTIEKLYNTYMSEFEIGDKERKN